jgi:ubiquinone/menaquinone biosynthesis C-methylase UbiE
MNEKKIDYGNWVPKKLVIIALCLTIIFTVVAILLFLLTFNIILSKNITIFPLFLSLNIVVWIIDFFCIICTVFFTSLYRAFNDNDGKLQDDIRNIVLEKLQWDGEGKALDIGTGSGYLAIKLAQFNNNSEAVGIDTWGKSWNYAGEVCEQNAIKEGVQTRTSFQKANASSLPFEDESFDAIVSNLVFHNIIKIRDKSKLFKEALRVLKKGGAFSIQDKVKSKKLYGNFERLEKKIKETGVTELHYIDTDASIDMPRSARMELKTMGIFYGIK